MNSPSVLITVKHLQWFEKLRPRCCGLLSHTAAVPHLLSKNKKQTSAPYLSFFYSYSTDYGGLVAGVHQFDPRCTGAAVLTHQSMETLHRPVPSSQHSSSSISLCSSWQLPEAPSQLQSRSTPGSKRADPPRTHPSFMGSNPRPEWVTGGRMGSQGERTMGLGVSIHVCVSLFHWSAMV